MSCPGHFTCQLLAHTEHKQPFTLVLNLWTWDITTCGHKPMFCSARTFGGFQFDAVAVNHMTTFNHRQQFPKRLSVSISYWFDDFTMSKLQLKLTQEWRVQGLKGIQQLLTEINLVLKVSRSGFLCVLGGKEQADYHSDTRHHVEMCGSHICFGVRDSLEEVKGHHKARENLSGCFWA